MTLATALAVAPAAAGPIDFDHHHPGPLETILHRAHLPTFTLDVVNPRIIDPHQMHARDCRQDLLRGGDCILRFDDTDRIDVEREGERRRFELLERVLLDD